MKDLVRRYRDVLPEERRLLTEILPQVLAGLPEDEVPWPLEGVEANLARLAILSGVPDAQAAATAIEPAVQRARRILAARLSGEEPFDIETASYAISHLALLLVLRAIGREVADVDPPRLLRMATGFDLNHDYRARGAFTALGYGLPELAGELLDGARVEPAEADLVDQGIAALGGSGSAEKLRGAWHAFLAALPDRAAADPAAWSAVVAAGRVVYCLLGDVPEGELVERIRAEVLR